MVLSAPRFAPRSLSTTPSLSFYLYYIEEFMSRRTSRQRHWYQLLREKSHQKEILIHDKNPLPSSEK
ncbi:Uncharacterised protein [Vibrio cholerae]|nr:Uncharacterised protein [Vibrio cholerae]